MKKWQLDQSHEAFLQQLGQKRLDQLKSSLTQQPGKKRILKKKATQTEKLIVAASRYIAGKIKAQNIETVLAGIGVSHLTAWLVYKRLKEEDISIQLMTETGYYGYEPVEGDPYIFNFGNLYTNSKQAKQFRRDFGSIRWRCKASLFGNFIGCSN
ncbi:hypothetical protein QS257_12030 [Terrilactibacillus sp. S3-3]|nr:hypothetical protein QS257_12030 [Terrilactibacillus sp. S3-3]